MLIRMRLVSPIWFIAITEPEADMKVELTRTDILGIEGALEWRLQVLGKQIAQADNKDVAAHYKALRADLRRTLRVIQAAKARS